ncbi:Gfo/Idh/MocA family oxidoreductase [Nocardioides sp. YIM 152315]|uniref:Gfo/Idh/MocA family protein n=1 Tax=Nocardioides sp. YIM 152315 TaxID=3031760 RepID=UPI0023DBE621|nr:Gfo/Idh/MocA family oxidoreductase [Nocardioides sp. YIM 152315]MDF1605475.1 Gfo/Idh/MocA family oxidoreductase [Nocardioides sp. YIM 152315]
MRLGLVGCGRIGGVHARSLVALDRVDELVVTDQHAPAATALAHDVGARAVDSVADLLREQVDGLLICSATAAHESLVLAAIEHRVPVLCEKPLAVDVAGTLRVVRAGESSGVPVQVGFQRRFDAGYRRARALVEEDALGAVHTVRACTLDPAPPPEQYIPLSGGIFRDCGVHDFDVIRWVTGREVHSVYAHGSARQHPVFATYGDVDTAVALLELEDGPMCSVSLARQNAAGYDVRLELLGERDSVAVGLDQRTPLAAVEPGAPRPSEPAWSGFQERFAAAYYAEVAGFLDVVAGTAAPACGPQDALEALYVAEAAQLSLTKGRPVSLAEVRA